MVEKLICVSIVAVLFVSAISAYADIVIAVLNLVM